MAELFGTEFSRMELCRRFGDMSQIADAREGVLSSGRADNMRVIDVKTGSGLDFSVFPSRGMDIGWASYKGVPISYMSPTGPVKPEFHEPQGRGFMRSFFCGLVTSCGITQMGRPCEDEGEELGQNGRISHTPASEVFVSKEWAGDDYNITVGGKMREACIFRENMLVTRKISTKLGAKSLVISDTVENQGFRVSPVLLMYHINFGYPVVSEHTKLHFSAPTEFRARDEVAQNGIERIDDYYAPTPGFSEQVFYHKLPQEQKLFTACLFNHSMGFGTYIRFDPQKLPHICQWKMCGEGEYVAGVEPGNAPTSGRALLKEQGILPTLNPGETVTFQVEIGVLESEDELNEKLAAK